MTSTSRARRRRRRAPPGGTRPRSAPRRPRAAARGCPRAAPRASSKPASIAKSSSSVGQLLELDLLDGHLEGRLAPGELAGCRSRRGSVSSTVRVSPALAPSSALLEAGDQVAAAELDQLVAALAAGEAAASARLARPRPRRRRASRRSRPRRSRRSRPGARRSPAAPGARACASISCSICSSSTAGSRRADLEALVLAELGLRQHADLDRELERLALRRAARRGRAAGRRRARCRRVSIASEYQLESVSRTASSSTASRPMRWITSGAGTLPRRKPGSFSSRPSWLRLALERGPRARSAGTSHLQPHARVAQLGDGGLHGGGHARHDTVPP